jgi:hypothetical protein
MLDASTVASGILSRGQLAGCQCAPRGQRVNPLRRSALCSPVVCRRDAYRLEPTDFHITVGYLRSDIHGIRKDASTLVVDWIGLRTVNVVI